jgi:hypothetical protein
LTNDQADEGNGSSTLHSFIIQIYIEEMEDMPFRTMQYGHITHLPDGERHYIKGLKEIADFIQAHLNLKSLS